MGSDGNFSNHIVLKQVAATAIDFSLEIAAGFLGAYFGAMLAALMVVLNNASPAATQNAVMLGVFSGFTFWCFAASWVNRVLIQGISRASFGKQIMKIEIVSTGAPISWNVMMKHWVSASFVGDVKVVSSLDTQDLAPVYQIHAVGKMRDEAMVQESNVVAISPAKESDKKAA